MGYLHIDNLYKNQGILAFKNVYALEKVHGTSAHISYTKEGVRYFSGGEKHDRFVSLFDTAAILAKFEEKFGPAPEHPIFIYGEAYGGKQQGMSPTYGINLKFVAFDVKIGDYWLSVPKAHDFVKEFNLDFVDYALIPTTEEALNAERDKDSTQAIKNGIGPSKIREGVVLRPPFECFANGGSRIIAKHKRSEFSEKSSGYPGLSTDGHRQAALLQAEAIAQEWVTPMRLASVINQIKSTRNDGLDLEMQDIPAIVSTMFADIEREAKGEVIELNAAKKLIGQRTVKLFKETLNARLKEAMNG
jgi:hypothetical protein